MKILWASEYRQHGGGYTAITEGMALGLHHCQQEVKIVGINYDGFQHPLPVSVIPLVSAEYLAVQIVEISRAWRPDVVVVALDLPHHVDILTVLCAETGFSYVGVFPVEGAPLLPRWADAVSQMDWAFTLSEFGVQTCAEAGVQVEFLPVACTPGILRAKPDDVARMREQIRLKDRFAILKIADNHSRKNWAHTIEFFAKWHKPEDVLCIVTRPENAYGWDLPAFLERFGARRLPQTTVWEFRGGGQARILSGLTRHDIAWLLHVCDVLLMDTGNEGAGMPILEAMWAGLPVVGMAHTAIREQLADGRGILFPCGYSYIDVFGNVERYYPNYADWSEALDRAKYMSAEERKAMVEKAQIWISNRSWSKAAAHFVERIRR